MNKSKAPIPIIPKDDAQEISKGPQLKPNIPGGEDTVANESKRPEFPIPSGTEEVLDPAKKAVPKFPGNMHEVSKTVPKIKMVSLAQLRDTCLLAKLMNRIYPNCF